MKLTEIKASKNVPVYVNLKGASISGITVTFTNNLKWDGERLYQAMSDMYVQRSVGIVGKGGTDEKEN